MIVHSLTLSSFAYRGETCPISRSPGASPRVCSKGSPRPRRPLQYDGMGQRLSTCKRPRLSGINRRPVQGQHSPSMSPFTSGSVVTKQAKTTTPQRSLPGPPPWKDTGTETTTLLGGLSRTSRRYFSLGPHMSCN
jgi:hypothetical protein